MSPQTLRARPHVATDAKPDADAHSRVLRQFRLVFSAVRRHFTHMEKSAGLGGAPIWALSLIAQQPGMRVNELARAMDIHQSTASNLVRQLLRKDLVRSDRSAQDRRNVVLQVTPAGQALLDGAPGPHEGVLPATLQKLSPHTLEQLHLHLGELLKVLQPDTTAAKLPLADL